MSYNRYDFNNNMKTNEDGKRVYSSVLYPQIPESDNDVYIITKETDRLDLLADTYYGDVTLWWVIAHANKIKGTFAVPPNIQIRIPADISSIKPLQDDLNS